jgi:flagellar assembly protein FliH
LHKIIKGEAIKQKLSCRRHSFPEISLNIDPDQKKKEEREKKNAFQRICIDSKIKYNSQKPGDVVNDNESEKKTAEKIAQIEEEAFNKGFSKGEIAGIETGIKRLEPVLDSFGKAISELKKLQKEIYLAAETETVTLALAIARKILSHEVRISENVVINVVKNALNTVTDPKSVKIKVNPADLQVLSKASTQVSDILDNTENISVLDNASIPRGECVIETDLGVIDARFEKQLEIIEAVFKSELEKSSTKDNDIKVK